MGRFTENMLRFYGDILQNHIARQQLLQELHKFAINLNKNVNNMLTHINQTRITTADKSAKDRKSFVCHLRREIIMLRRNLIEDLKKVKEARLAVVDNKQAKVKTKKVRS
jgi:hypothetical protein